MPIYTGPGGLHPLSGAGGTVGEGDWQVWNTDAGQYSFLPLSPGTDYYSTMFYNSGAHARVTGVCYWNLNISQNHGGSFQFYMSQYGVGITEIYNSGYASFSGITSINSVAGHNGVQWANTNNAGWGNGYLHWTVLLHGAGATNYIVSGVPEGAGQTNYDNTHGQPTTAFCTKVI